MDVIFWSSDGSGDTSPTPFRYIGPYKISHWIKKHGYTSQVIDFVAHFSEFQLYSVTKKFITQKTLVLGISTTFMCNHRYTRSDGSISNVPESVENVAIRLKNEYPNLKIVLGGYGSDKIFMKGIPHAALMSYVSSNEDVFLEYVNHCKTAAPLPVGKLTMSYNDTTDTSMRMWYDTPRNITYNIEYDDFKFTKNDCVFPGESLPLDVSKGCIFACKFCSYPHLGKKKLDYIRGMEYIKEELIYNYENFNVTNYMILDDTFNDTLIKINAFKKMVDTLPFKITYTAYIRADLIHRFPDMADMLKEGGIIGAIHGIESMNPYASNLIGKAWSGKHAKDFLPTLYHDIWNREVAQQLNFIIGLPRDTAEDINETIAWATTNNMYGLHVNHLGIVSPETTGKKFNMHTITNELGRNPEKYGFEFNKFGYWKNETWSQASSFQFYKYIMAQLYNTPLHKQNAWFLGNLMKLGYSMEHILTTPINEYDTTFLKNSRKNAYLKYFVNMMKL
jgi:hypothetical protein